MNVLIDSSEFDLGLESRIEANLKEGNEVTLEHYDAVFHGNMCLKLGKIYGMQLVFNPNQTECRFKKSSNQDTTRK
jgi:hypothetical protein